MKTLLLVILLFSFSVCAQNKIESFDILTGKWKLESSNFTLIEEWEKINDTVFAGISHIEENGEKNISEKLHILKLYDHIVYIAQPGNNLPTLFTLISSEGNKFVFENNEHDFPQRVVYHFISNDRLNAFIEGEEEGKMKREEFSFKRLK
jgi:hypothetical protein